MPAPIRSALTLVILLLALAGMGLSAVSLYNHYQRSPTDYCDLGPSFNCDLVNRSVYSRFLGVPVALIGLVGYGLVGVLSFLPRSALARGLLLAGGLAGLAFSLYLTYLEAYILAVWCILCLASLAIIAVITILSGVLVLRAQPEGS